MGLPERTARRLNELNTLIPELQTLVTEKRLGVVVGAALAGLSAEDQQALWEALARRPRNSKRPMCGTPGNS